MPQTTINKVQPQGIVGEPFSSYPMGVTTYVIAGTATADPVIGLACTLGTSGETPVVGGTGKFAGIIVNPKDQVAKTALTATMDITIGTESGTKYARAPLAKEGMWWVKNGTAVTYGGEVQYNTDTGALSQPTSAGTPDAKNVILKGAIWASNQTNANTLALVQLGGAY